MFRVLTPIIRSSYNCKYSFWYWLTGSTTIRFRCWVRTQQREPYQWCGGTEESHQDLKHNDRCPTEFRAGQKETISLKEACSAFLLTDGWKHKCFTPCFGQFRLEEMKLLSKDVYIYCVVMVYHHQAAVLQWYDVLHSREREKMHCVLVAHMDEYACLHQVFTSRSAIKHALLVACCQHTHLKHITTVLCHANVLGRWTNESDLWDDAGITSGYDHAIVGYKVSSSSTWVL